MTEPLPTTPNTPADRSLGQQLRNLLIVAAAVVLSVAIVWGLNTQDSKVTLATLATDSIPYEEALGNQQPTLVEFYANWCTSCQAMAPDMAQLRQAYGQQVNFVMLNVDNNKWLPEMLTYQVEGIPHFVYLDAQGEAISTAVGEMPRLILADNLEALVAQQPLPHQQVGGRTTVIEEPSSSTIGRQDDPRSHGAQVVN